MSIENRLVKFIEDAKANKGKKATGFEVMTAEEVEEFHSLLDENNEIEVNGAKIKMVESLDELPEEERENAWNSLKEAMENDEDLKEQIIEQALKDASNATKLGVFLTSEEMEEKTTKLVEFLIKEEIDYMDLLGATLSIGLHQLGKPTMETLGMTHDSEYLDYIDELQAEMKATQILLSSGKPVLASNDLIMTGLFMALETLALSSKQIEDLLMTQRLAVLKNPERLREVAKLKFEMASEVREMGKSFENEEEIIETLHSLIMEQTGLNSNDLLQDMKNGVSISEIAEKLNNAHKANLSHSKMTC